MVKNVFRRQYETNWEKLNSNLECLTSPFKRTQLSVNITDENILPEDYLIPQPPKVDKTSLKEALKSGIEVPGAELKQTEGLRIR